MGSATMQGQIWSMAAHDWAELQEPTSMPLWEAMLDAAMVGSGTHLLDAGCGAGCAGVLAARRGAQINGVDASAALLAIARQQVPDGDFRVGDLEALPYADGTFDAIIAANVVSYVANPLTALRELKRVSAPAGRAVLATWAPPMECWERMLITTIREVVPADLTAECCPHCNSFAALRALEELLAQAGLVVADSGEVACPCDYADQETACQAQLSAGPLQAIKRIVGAARLRTAVQQALAPYTSSVGRVHVVNHFRFVVAVPADGQPDSTGTAGCGKGGDET